MHYFVPSAGLSPLRLLRWLAALQSLSSSFLFVLTDFLFAVLAQTYRVGGPFQQNVPIG